MSKPMERPSKPSSRTKTQGAAGGSKRSSKPSEMETKVKLVQRLCFYINGREKDENMSRLYRQAIEALNRHKEERAAAVPLAEEACRERLRTIVKLRGCQDDMRCLDEALVCAHHASDPGKLAAQLHFLGELASLAPAQKPQKQAKPKIQPQIKPQIQPQIQIQPQAQTQPQSQPATMIMKQVHQLASAMEAVANANANVKALQSAASPGASTSASTSTPSASGSLTGTSSDMASVSSGSLSSQAAALRSAAALAAAESTLPSRDDADLTEVTEGLLVRDLIYSFQGVDGRFLKFNHIKQAYDIDAQVPMPLHWRSATVRLAELSLRQREVAAAAAAGPAAAAGGVVAQAMAAALRDQLTEFYRLVALVQAEMEGGRPSLRLLALRMRDAEMRMRWLAALARACAGLRGGALLSRAHGFLQHGAPNVRLIVRSLLDTVCVPLVRTLTRWLLDGELADPFSEFFIAGSPDVAPDRLWQDKYRVHQSMVPSFIPMPVAEKILAVGKSINFLREVCADRSDLPGRAALKSALSAADAADLFAWDFGGGGRLESVVDAAYRDTAARVIHVMADRFQLTVHLQALRDFLLLGQGDFIGHLMELLEPELVGAGCDVRPHNVSALLDAAVRTTNAQFAPADTLARLDVRVLNASPGDAGWDVFTLDYHVTGPIGTVFAPTMTSYLVLFQALWKAKRIEWVLSRMWKQQATGSKMLRNIPELAPVMQQIHLLTSEMIHFVHQMQYYVLFEVIECSWEELATNVREAQSLDDIIAAHRDFLVKVKAGALLDPATRNLSIQLRAMFETVLQLQAQVDALHAHAHRELDNRTRRKQLIKERGGRGEFGISVAEEAEFKDATHAFLSRLLPNIRIQIKSLATSYQNCVRKLLLMLSGSGLVSLQLLSFRLDFNETYKRTQPAARRPAAAAAAAK